MRDIYIISSEFSNREEALEYIGRELGFPEYYGANLDALYDCLVDYQEDTGFIFVYARDYEDDWMDDIVQVVDDAAFENLRLFRYNLLKIGHEYLHFKNKSYLVEDIARHSEDSSWYVVYRRLYADRGLWIRPCPMFLGRVDRDKYPHVMQYYRFQLVD